MLPVIVKIAIGFIMSFTMFMIVKILTKNKDKFSLYHCLVILIIALPIFVLYKTQYTALISIIMYILAILLSVRCFKISLLTSIIFSSFGLLIISLSDLIFSCINLMIFSYDQVRNIWYISIINNILVSGLSIWISKREFISTRLDYICKKVEFKI